MKPLSEIPFEPRLIEDTFTELFGHEVLYAGEDLYNWPRGVDPPADKEQHIEVSTWWDRDKHKDGNFMPGMKCRVGVFWYKGNAQYGKYTYPETMQDFVDNWPSQIPPLKRRK